MLEFIVLGQIPGTSIQITFTQLVRIGLLFVVVILIGLELRVHKTHKIKLDLQTLINRLAL